jgi:hypothetical protein
MPGLYLEIKSQPDKVDQLNKKIQDYKKKHKAKDYTKKTLVMGSLNIAIEIVAAVAVGFLKQISAQYSYACLLYERRYLTPYAPDQAI